MRQPRAIPRTAILSTFFFTAILLFYFRAPLFHFQPYYGVDLFEHVPIRLWMAQELRALHLPLWNPYHSCGMPMAADDFTWGIYYPPILLDVLTPGFSITLSALLHISVAFFFIRRLVLYLGGSEQGAFLAGTTFCFGAPLITALYAGSLNILFGASLIAPVLYYSIKVAKGDGGKAALAISMSLELLGSHAEIAFFAVIFCFILAWRSAAGHRRALIALYALGFGISAIHLLPVAEVYYLSQSMRSTYWTSRVASDQSFPLAFLFSLITPGLFGKQSAGTYWGPPFDYLLSKYIGLIPLLLIPVALLNWKNQDKLRRTVLLLLLFTFFMSLGKGSGFSQIGEYIPIVRQFSVPSNLMIFVCFFAALISGLELERWNDNRTKSILFGIFALAVAGLFLIRLHVIQFPESLTPVPGSVQFHVALYATLLTLSLVLLLFAFWKFAKTNVLIVAFQVLTLCAFTSPWIQATPLNTYVAASKWRFLSNDMGLFRVYDHGSLPITDKYAPNQSLSNGPMDAIYFHVFRLQGGTTTLALNRYHEFKSFLNTGSAPQKDAFFFLNNLTSPLLQFLNVRYLVTSERLNDPKWLFLQKTTSFYIYRNRNEKQRAQIYHKYEVEKHALDILNKMGSSDKLYLEQELPKELEPVEANTDADQVRWLKYSPNHIEVEASSRSPGLLLLSEVYFPGWKATIDNRPTPVFQANYVFRAVSVPSGSHILRMWYRPHSWMVGALLTTLSVVVTAALAIRHAT